MTQDSLQNGDEIVCLTPLYQFSSDAAELIVDRGIRICRFDQFPSIPCDEETAKHLRIHAPDYLLWHSPLMSGEIGIEGFSALVATQALEELVVLFLGPTQKFFQLLRLFKPGRLRAGETFILRVDKSGDCETWHTLGSGRASAMAIDYSVIASQEVSYGLDRIEAPFLTSFRASLSPVLSRMTSLPSAQFALQIYAADDGKLLDVVTAFTALEALLTRQDETEGLTHRLSMRVANLLGQDANARRDIFARMKKFYDLRSRIVHGGAWRLKPALLDRLNDLDALREILRRVLLCALALISEGESLDELPAVLDDLSFDDEKRRLLQSRASRFLHVVASRPAH